MPSRHLHRSALCECMCSVCVCVCYVLISTLITCVYTQDSVLTQITWFWVNTCKHHNSDSLHPKLNMLLWHENILVILLSVLADV